MKGLQLILMIRSILSKLNVSLDDLFKLFNEVMDIGAPPEIGDETTFRAWLKKIASVLSSVALVTPIEFDDVMAKFLSGAIANDSSWKLFYRLLSTFMQRPDGTMGDFEFQASVTQQADDLSKLMAEQSAAIDPMTIIAIMKMIMDIIKNWKK